MKKQIRYLITPCILLLSALVHAGIGYYQTETLLDQCHNLNPRVLTLAMRAYECARLHGVADPKGLMTIIDYSLPSTQKRLWVLDLTHHRMLYHTFVTHGKNSGGLKATHFSNNLGSDASSIGLFETEGTYIGHEGYSMRLKGLEPGFNNHAEARHVVMHGAWYATQKIIDNQGSLGRSWGCPAIPPQLAHPVIHLLKGGSLLFAYYPESHWLQTSRYLHCVS